MTDQEGIVLCQALIDDNEDAVRESLYSGSVVKIINSFVHVEQFYQYKLPQGLDNRNMITPLFFAMIHSSYILMAEVVERGASLRNLTDCQDTALHLVSYSILDSMTKCEYIINKDKTLLKCVNSTRNRPLNVATIANNYDVLLMLISHGAHVHFKGVCGRTPLILAAANGNIQCLETLILHIGAQINSTDDNNDTALILASRLGHIACVEALLEHESLAIHARHHFGNQAIHDCSMKGHNDILVMLIEKGADVSAKGPYGRTPLLMSAESGTVECLKTLLHNGAQINSTDDNNDTALILASRLGHITCVEALLEHEPLDIHARHHFGNQAIHDCSMKGHNDILVMLIEKGADVSAKGPYGRTPLLMSAESGKVECLKTLLHNGAQINSTDDNNDTALILASRLGHITCVEALLEHEPLDIHARHHFGNQAIHDCSMKGHNDILVMLIEKGADVSAKGPYGRTPLLMSAES